MKLYETLEQLLKKRTQLRNRQRRAQKKYNQTFIEQIEALKPDGTNEEKRFVELLSRRFEGNQVWTKDNQNPHGHLFYNSRAILQQRKRIQEQY